MQTSLGVCRRSILHTSWSGSASWNSLPVDLFTVSDTSDFNNKLKNLSFQVSIQYSVDIIINFCFVHLALIFSV